MTPQQIRDAIAASPALQAMQAAGNHQGIADALSVGLTEPYSRITTARGLAEFFPGGPLAAEAVLLKLEGSAVTLKASADSSQKLLGSLLSRQLGFLNSEGLDFGSAALRGMLDYFASIGILTSSEATGLKAIAERPAKITHESVTAAIHGA